MALVLVLLFVVVPIAELYVIIQVGQSIGVLNTIGLLILDSIVGAWLAKREGIRAWRAFTTAMAAGQIPAREAADGALVLFGGALLMTPGFLTDGLGLLLLLPPTRAAIRRIVLRAAKNRVTFGMAGGVGVPTRRRGEVIDAEPVTRVDSVRTDVDDSGNGPGHAPRGG